MTKPTFTLTDSVVRKNKLAREEREALVRARLEHRKKMKTDQFKVEAVKAYILLGGNAMLTASTIGVSRNCLEKWKRTSWWTNLVKEFRNEERLYLSSSTKKIIQKSLEELSDRLERGDFIYDPKTGQMVRKPVPAKDLHRISVDMMERKDKIDKAIDHVDDNNETNEDKLSKLAEQFAQLAIKAVNKKPQAEVVDIPFVEEVK